MICLIYAATPAVTCSEVCERTGYQPMENDFDCAAPSESGICPALDLSSLRTFHLVFGVQYGSYAKYGEEQCMHVHMYSVQCIARWELHPAEGSTTRAAGNRVLSLSGPLLLLLSCGPGSSRGARGPCR